uniref:Uncharacterized protein n=1 Tax=Plectus sambesii TaxID=2011161 RepID=A0A914VRF7_9BILA
MANRPRWVGRAIEPRADEMNAADSANDKQPNAQYGPTGAPASFPLHPPSAVSTKHGHQEKRRTLPAGSFDDCVGTPDRPPLACRPGPALSQSQRVINTSSGRLDDCVGNHKSSCSKHDDRVFSRRQQCQPTIPRGASSQPVHAIRRKTVLQRCSAEIKRRRRRRRLSIFADTSMKNASHCLGGSRSHGPSIGDGRTGPTGYAMCAGCVFAHADSLRAFADYPADRPDATQKQKTTATTTTTKNMSAI